MKPPERRDKLRNKAAHFHIISHRCHIKFNQNVLNSITIPCYKSFALSGTFAQVHSKLCQKSRPSYQHSAAAQLGQRLPTRAPQCPWCQMLSEAPVVPPMLRHFIALYTKVTIKLCNFNRCLIEGRLQFHDNQFSIW